MNISYLFILFFFGTNLLLGQQDTLTNNYGLVKDVILNETIVSATRSKRQLSSLPLAAQIISKKEINQTNTIRLNDILNEQTGLITVQDYGGGQGIQLQGMDSQYILIMIDGVPIVGRSAGTLDLSRISVGNIDQIEIVKGASSSLYGNEALGGVINIITENPENGFHTNIDYRVGSFNKHDLNTKINFKKNKFGVLAFINRLSSDGYDLIKGDPLNTVEPFENHTLNVKLTYEPTKKNTLLISSRYYKQLQKNVAAENLTGESKINEWNTLLKLDHKFDEKWNGYFELYTTRYLAKEYLNNDSGNLNSESNFNQLLLKPEVRLYYNINKHSIIGGAGITHEALDRTDFLGKPVFNAPYIYIQYDGYISRKLKAIIGGRFDNHSEYESQFSPKAALKYNINNNVAVKGSIGMGFKAPDFRQLYFDFTNATVGYTVLGYNAVNKRISQLNSEGQITYIGFNQSDYNNKLKAENSISYNIGFDYIPTNKLKFSINLFRNDISNLIDTRVIARKSNGQNVFSYYNVNEVYTQGIELDGIWEINDKLSLSAGYQLLGARDKEAEEAFKNNRVFARINPSSPAFLLKEKDYFGLFNRSTHMINFKLFYNIPELGLNANLRSTYRSKYGIFDSNANAYLDNYDDFISGYSIWDFAINLMVLKHHKMGFGIENFFNFKNPTNISNIAGRIIYTKININI